MKVKLTPGFRRSDTPPFFEMDAYEFQKMCRELFAKEPKVTICEIYGHSGQSQDGIDLLASRSNDNGTEVGQCKCYQKFPPAEFRKATNEFFKFWKRWRKERVRRFVLFVAADLSSRRQMDAIIKEKKRFRLKGLRYEAWSSSTIRDKLRPHRAIANSYLLNDWVQMVCGPPTMVLPPFSEASEQTNVVVQSVLVAQLGGLSHHVTKEMVKQLEEMRNALREGYSEKAARWLAETKRNTVLWSTISPEVKSKIVGFEAILEINESGDILKAKRLLEEATALDPSNTHPRLRAIIVYKEKGASDALQVIDGFDDVDSLNLKVSFLLELGRVPEAEAILEELSKGANADGGNKS